MHNSHSSNFHNLQFIVEPFCSTVTLFQFQMSRVGFFLMLKIFDSIYFFCIFLYLLNGNFLHFNLMKLLNNIFLSNADLHDKVFRILSYLQNWSFPHGFCFDFICFVERSKDGDIFKEPFYSTVLFQFQMFRKDWDFFLMLTYCFFQVDDVFGFNITYELLPNKQQRRDVCTLTLCNFNGQCFLNLNQTTGHVG